MKSYIKNDIFEGIVGESEFKALSNDGLIPLATAVISIQDPVDYLGKPPVSLDLSKFKNSISLSFWDTEDDDGSYPTISDEQAKELIKFVKDNIDSKFMIHCHAGMSRSAGVGQFIEYLKVYNGNLYDFRIGGSELTKFERYIPNKKVFDKLMLEEQKC